MNKRQRKKHRLGEFQECGFALRFRTPAHWSSADHDAFWDACITQVEALGLAVGGGAGAQWDVFVTGLTARASVSAAQREALLAWLAAQPDVSAVEAGPLIDAWHAAPGTNEAAA